MEAHARGAARTRDALPFSGLGFDLGAVAVRAGRMVFSGRRAAAVISSRAIFPVTWLAAGYALQLRLGRETRGS